MPSTVGMRPWLLAMGAVMAALGLLFTFVPLFTPTGGSPYGATATQAHSMLLPARYDFSWSQGGAADYVMIVDCGTLSPSNLSASTTTPQTPLCPQQSLLAHGSGGSGMLAVSVPNGHWAFIVVFQNVSGVIDLNARISATATQGYWGFPLLLLGAVLVVFALLTHPRKGPTAAPWWSSFSGAIEQGGEKVRGGGPGGQSQGGNASGDASMDEVLGPLGSRGPLKTRPKSK